MKIIEDKILDMDFDCLIDYFDILKKDINKAYYLFIYALNLDFENFDIKNYQSYKYSILEFRILKEIAFCYDYKENYERYSNIILFCYENAKLFKNTYTYSSIKISYITILLKNKQFEKCLNLINESIKKAYQNDKVKYLPYLYFLKYQVYTDIGDEIKATKYLDSTYCTSCELKMENLIKIIEKNKVHIGTSAASLEASTNTIIELYFLFFIFYFFIFLHIVLDFPYNKLKYIVIHLGEYFLLEYYHLL